jgi:hypothetical protein
MTLFCTIEYGSTVEERRCGRVAVAECADCGASVCSICCKGCCGKAMCGYCYDYHVMHSCVRGSGPTELRPVQRLFACACAPTSMPCNASRTGLTTVPYIAHGSRNSRVTQHKFHASSAPVVGNSLQAAHFLLAQGVLIAPLDIFHGLTI